MKRAFLLFAATMIAAAITHADTPSQMGTVISESSVSCGASKGGRGGKKSLDILCQQYVVHTGTTDYQIRQEKPSSAALIPVNTPSNSLSTKTR